MKILILSVTVIAICLNISCEGQTSTPAAATRPVTTTKRSKLYFLVNYILNNSLFYFKQLY